MTAQFERATTTGSATVAAIKGETTKPEIGTGFTTITKDNLDENQDALYKSSC